MKDVSASVQVSANVGSGSKTAKYIVGKQILQATILFCRNMGQGILWYI
ncbi:hypothetical protein HMPREF2532_04231 [Bacteroides ovatus]|uniref:Uncharacterized protein n=1 Tax=Bacteroides xylanisolvens SD CC 1b TaxID=702447 RepID=W6P3U2_9BACE|nr:hypothetical protein HMPREF2532_04231 [Bacteroides ovatus]CDM01258.1 hypothetical protein BN891_41890 [Bacteroides xylanisolvens SD CC 2a]CDM04334.1 hypothetical protein BN890_19090 [Bacteroides xylanisolvens SD CC 1b]